MDDLDTFYSSVCACSNTKKECPDVINDPNSGWPPRGFYSQAKRENVKILAVGKNPGHPIPGECALYAGHSFQEIAAIHMEFAAATFQRQHDNNTSVRHSTRFHKNLLRYFAYFLDVPEEKVFQHIVYTNLVKCSTPDEQAILSRQVMNECFRKHFARELDFFKPKLLVAFGREVENFLLKAKKMNWVSLPIIYLKHPSYHYKRDAEKEVLLHIKNQIQEHIGVCSK